MAPWQFPVAVATVKSVKDKHRNNGNTPQGVQVIKAVGFIQRSNN
jgi:hypothetical protein